MSEEEILSLAEILVSEYGIKKIRLTGGEPLVRENVDHIFKELAKLPVELTLTTNAVLLEKFIPLFKDIELTSLNISLDSLLPDNYKNITRFDHFFDVFRNINLALAEGFHVKINTVVQRGVNSHEILDFIEWTRETPVHVRFLEFMPYEGIRWKSEKVVPYHEILDKISDKYLIEKLDGKPHSTKKSYRVKSYKGTFSVISSVSQPFCSGCNRIRLTADGKLKNCLLTKDEVDLLSPMRRDKDIRSLIDNCISSKKEERNGLISFEDTDAYEIYAQGRCKTAIGG